MNAAYVLARLKLSRFQFKDKSLNFHQSICHLPEEMYKYMQFSLMKYRTGWNSEGGWIEVGRWYRFILQYSSDYLQIG